MTALVILYPQLSTPRIVGSDIAHAVPLTLIAGSGHWIRGSVDTFILGSLLTGSIPGTVVGSRMTFMSLIGSCVRLSPPFCLSPAVGW